MLVKSILHTQITFSDFNISVYLVLQDFGRIVKFYNRIATALVKFESLWLGLWKSRIDSSLGGLKTSLLAQDPETKQLVVNADGRYELISVAWHNQCFFYFCIWTTIADHRFTHLKSLYFFYFTFSDVWWDTNVQWFSFYVWWSYPNEVKSIAIKQF